MSSENNFVYHIEVTEKEEVPAQVLKRSKKKKLLPLEKDSRRKQEW